MILLQNYQTILMVSTRTEGQQFFSSTRYCSAFAKLQQEKLQPYIADVRLTRRQGLIEIDGTLTNQRTALVASQKRCRIGPTWSQSFTSAVNSTFQRDLIYRISILAHRQRMLSSRCLVGRGLGCQQWLWILSHAQSVSAQIFAYSLLLSRFGTDHDCYIGVARTSGEDTSMTNYAIKLSMNMY